jgi:hypothetical protein
LSISNSFSFFKYLKDFLAVSFNSGEYIPLLLQITYIREEVIHRDGHEFYDGPDDSDCGSDCGGGDGGGSGGCSQTQIELVTTQMKIFLHTT